MARTKQEATKTVTKAKNSKPAGKAAPKNTKKPADKKVEKKQVDKKPVEKKVAPKKPASSKKEVAKDSKSSTDSISSMKRPELVAALGELDISESSVKRADGARGKPTISDLRTALEKAQKKGGKKPVKSATPKASAPKGKAAEKDVDYDALKKRVEKLEKSITKLTEEVTSIRELLAEKDKKPAKNATKKNKKEESDEDDASEHSSEEEDDDAESLVDSEDEDDDKSDDSSESAEAKEDEEEEEGEDDSAVVDSDESSEKTDEDETIVVPYPEKGYGLDGRGYVYTLGKEEDSKVVGKLVKDKVVPLTSSDISELKKLRIDYTKKTADELKKLLIPVGENTSVPTKKKEPVKEESGSEEPADSKSSHKEEGDSAAEGKEIIVKDDESNDKKDIDDQKISKHFEKPAEVTEEDFKKYVTAVYSNKVNVQQATDIIAKAIGTSESVAGRIIEKYTYYTKKWPQIVETARQKTKTVTTTTSSSTTVAGGRKKLAPHKK